MRRSYALFMTPVLALLLAWLPRSASASEAPVPPAYGIDEPATGAVAALTERAAAMRKRGEDGDGLLMQRGAELLASGELVSAEHVYFDLAKRGSSPIHRAAGWQGLGSITMARASQHEHAWLARFSYSRAADCYLHALRLVEMHAPTLAGYKEAYGIIALQAARAAHMGSHGPSAGAVILSELLARPGSQLSGEVRRAALIERGRMLGSGPDSREASRLIGAALDEFPGAFDAGEEILLRLEALRYRFAGPHGHVANESMREYEAALRALLIEHGEPGLWQTMVIYNTLGHTTRDPDLLIETNLEAIELARTADWALSRDDRKLVDEMVATACRQILRQRFAGHDAARATLVAAKVLGARSPEARAEAEQAAREAELVLSRPKR